jgi:hypothetical protein
LPFPGDVTDRFGLLLLLQQHSRLIRAGKR